MTCQKCSTANGGALSINMSHMSKWKVTGDNVKHYDQIMVCSGKFHTLDVRPYVALLNEFNIFYTLIKQ